MENIGKNIKEIFQDKYIIPLYQRNFAWEEPEIEKLLQDIYESYNTQKNQYFLGSLIVIRRKNTNIYEVIDGQQRLTALSLILKELGEYEETTPQLVLSYDSRPEVEDFLKRYYSSTRFDEQEGVIHASTKRMREAMGIIRETQLDAKSDKAEKKIGSESWGEKKDFQKYLYENVKLVRVEIPDDTDVAAYFEIMNNRGTQLQDHEVIKSRLMEKIKNGGDYDLVGQTLFAEIWDACSQMDSHVQSNFAPDIRKILFTDQYSNFSWDWEAAKNVIQNRQQTDTNEKRTDKALSVIIENKENYLNDKKKENNQPSPKNDEEDETEIKYYSIIDFPNFLMHVFKVYYNEKYKDKDEKKQDIPLHDKYLISVYDILEMDINPEEFIKNLLWSRVVFDRYMVKSEDPEKMAWSLKKAYKSGKGLKFELTFENDLQDKCIKLLSMLQVTFRSRYYKNFLQCILTYFKDKENLDDKDGIDYLNDLHQYVVVHLDSLQKVENWNCQGTDTPHFILNLIDYLYWFKSLSDTNIKLENFDFRNLNSVEHHLARNLVDEKTDTWVNELGNLYLLGKNENSHLNDRFVAQKIADYFDESGNLRKDKNIGPNRQIMYKESKKNGNAWTRENIQKHTEELENMLNDAAQTLGIN